MSRKRIYLLLITALSVAVMLAVYNYERWRIDTRRSACLRQLADIEAAKEQYALEHDGAAPDQLGTLVPRYLPAVPVCPSGGDYLPGDLQRLVSCTFSGHVLRW